LLVWYTSAMRRIRAIVAVVFVVVVAIFIAQNTRVVEVHFLGWKLSMSRAIMLFAVLGIGFALGWLTSRRRVHRD
jgi:uncharacterized integral membrane protein